MAAESITHRASWASIAILSSALACSAFELGIGGFGRSRFLKCPWRLSKASHHTHATGRQIVIGEGSAVE